MASALAAQRSSQQRVADIRANVTAARQAAAVSVARIAPTNGLSERGLYPVASIREAMRLVQEGGDANRVQADLILANARAASDPTGKATWEGAGLPQQTEENGRTVVSITQNQSRALLSWNRFDVGENTTVRFNQKENGVAQTGWTAVNRVVDSADPTVILGRVEADGGVYILNRNGVIFGKGAQTNLHSLVASSLELGNYASSAGRTVDRNNANSITLAGLTLQARNVAYLSSGVLPTASNPTYREANGAPPLFLSPLLGAESVQGTTSSAIRFGALEGSVIVDPGASLTVGTGGMLVLAAPRVENHGLLSAVEGQVSLIGGRLVTFARSDGSSTGVDPNVRGLVFRALEQDNRRPEPNRAPTPEDGVVLNRGFIESRRGYLSLVTTAMGDVVNDGLLSATTSVSRNGKIALYGGRVTIGGNANANEAGGISITPEDNGETIPQGSPAQPANFKRSQVEIGALVFRQSQGSTAADLTDLVADPVGRLTQSTFVMGENSVIYAPNADVIVGGGGQSQINILRPEGGTNNFALVPSSITIGAGALVDVSGLKDIAVDVGRNFLTITPVKRNELRDTPTYREVAIGDEFTLNGKTLTVDIRNSGEREDGVRWIGSPLIEAGSLASQIPVSASELMTEGGNVTFASSQNVSLGQGAVVDISGGWISYTGTEKATSKLVTADGRIVDIADADPNESYVSVYEGFTSQQPRFGLTNTTTSSPISGSSGREVAYDEGRDAGSFVVEALATRIDGILRGSAYAGQLQLIDGTKGSAASGITGDPRKMQASGQELPSGGYVRLPTFGDIVVYRGALTGEQSGFATMMLSDAMLSASGLSALSLEAFGSVEFADATVDTALDVSGFTTSGSSSVSLANGAILTVKAGRSIRFDGSVRIAGGTINATTQSDLTAILNTADSNTVVGLGSTFRTDDDVFAAYAGDTAALTPFDISVTGSLSTAGRWVNDSLADELIAGKAWTNGGAINLNAAANVFVAAGDSVSDATTAVDLSGSILLREGALLNVSAGGYITPGQSFDLSARGGNVSLVAATRYAGVRRTQQATIENSNGRAESVFGGDNQTISFTPVAAAGESGAINPALVPATPRARVDIADGTLAAFGFAGSGTFRLVAPDIAFGSEAPSANSTRIGLDFVQKTGFGALDLTSNRSALVDGLFDNGSLRRSAFAATTSFTVRAGETLDLTQASLPQFLSAGQAQSLAALETGGDMIGLLRDAALVPTDIWDRRAVNLTIGGLGELVVEQGGAVIGAPEAVITTPKLINSGLISLPSGKIVQSAQAASVDQASAFLGVHSLADLLGAENGNDEGAQNLLVRDEDGRFLTNAELFTATGKDRMVVLLGVGDETTGIRLDAGSVTDLSGIALYDPRAPFGRRSTGEYARLRLGRLLGGGSLTTTSAFNDEGQNLSLLSRTLDVSPNAIVDISGTTGVFDRPTLGAGSLETREWSKAGRIAMLGGGTLAGARINALGGYDESGLAEGARFVDTGIADLARAERRAEGGTFEVARPTLTGAQDTAGLNSFWVDQLEEAGFDSLIARGGLTLDGDFDFSLRKALFVTGDVTRSGGLRVGTYPVVRASDGTDAGIEAGYIGFRSLMGDALTTGGIVAQDPASDNPASVTFAAGQQGIDFFGASQFGPSIGSLEFVTSGDIRFSGVDGRLQSTRDTQPNGRRLNGEIMSFGDTLFDGARIYTTTGTGNLQLFLEKERAGEAVNTADTRPFLISALGDHSIRFASSLAPAADPATPLSAGSYLRVLASEIAQDGNLFVPLGRIELGGVNFTDTGSARATTRSVIFGEGSLTSVSARGTSIPYGTTLDLKDHYFTPLSFGALTALPTAELRVAGDAIDVQAGATVDLSGGGDLFTYEFVSGVGGSRDVLSRFNSDVFSSNGYNPATGTGTQYSDGRQVFAIVPKEAAAAIAAYDPLYSADYGSDGPVDLYGLKAGTTVTLDGGNGIAAGEYVLMPAHYALLEGAYRIVENSGDPAPEQGASFAQIDGGIIMGGSYGLAGSEVGESTRRSFTLQSADSFKSYSQIEVRSGATLLAANSTAAPGSIRLPSDAARLVLAPLASLRAAGLFRSDHDGKSRGVEADISADRIIVATEGTADTQGYLTIWDSTLAGLGAQSLFLGGTRIENRDGTTDLRVDANEIIVRGGVSLALPEVLLATGNEISRAFGVSTFGPSRLAIEDGASLVATGALGASPTTDYVIRSFATAPSGWVGDISGSGSLLRVSTGPDRAPRRTGDGFSDTINAGTGMEIGAATLGGNSVNIATTRSFTIAPDVALETPSLSLSAENLVFNGTQFAPELEARLGQIDTLTLQSRKAVGFGTGEHSFRNLVVDAQGIALSDATPGGGNRPRLVSLFVDSLRLSNEGEAAAACSTVSCGNAASSLSIVAGTRTLAEGETAGEDFGRIVFGNGTFRTSRFGGSVSLTASQGMFVEGKGAFDVGRASLSLVTPFIADRALAADPRKQMLRPDFAFNARGGTSISAGSFAVPTIGEISGNRAPGSRIAFGDADTRASESDPLTRAFTLSGTLVLATAGLIKVDAGSIALDGGATLAAPGWTRSFGDDLDKVTVAASGGAVDLLARNGNISGSAGVALISDTGIGEAGTIALRAPQGAVDFAGTYNAGVAVPRANDFILDSGTGSFDLASFHSGNATRFQGELSIRSGAGDLSVLAGQGWKGESISLTADGGAVSIAGTLDTSGVDVSGMKLADAKNARVNGGAIALYGQAGVSLASTALLDTHTSGYAAADPRSASAGDVTLGIGLGEGSIVIAPGARIDAAARRTQQAQAAGLPTNRLVAETAKDGATLADITVYRFVEADRGGTLTLRAPLIGAGGDTVNLVLPSRTGIAAGSIQLEGYRRYDLDAIAADPTLGGVNAVAGGVVLQPGEGGGRNILTDTFVTESGLASISSFVRDFSVQAADGSDLTGMRLRPGVDMVSKGSIAVEGVWNLAAATVDQAGAAAAGLLTINSELGTRPESYGLNQAGTPYYSLTTENVEQVLAQFGGAYDSIEGALLDLYADFTYRVGGKASGEAPMLRLRGAGDVTVARSINDGFFVFRDRSDQAYISYQLGGGTRTYDTALRVVCGPVSGDSCFGLAQFGDTVSVGERNQRSVRISLANATFGRETSPVGTIAPFSAETNSAAALGNVFDVKSGERIAGAGLEYGELFPLLAGGATMHSSDIGLTAGGLITSANADYVDYSRNADLVVTDMTTAPNGLDRSQSYRLEADKVMPLASGRLALVSGNNVSSPSPSILLEDFLATSPDAEFSGLDENSYSIFTWGGLQAQGRAYFGERGREFTGTRNNPTGVIAPFGEVVAFLNLYAPEILARVESGSIGTIGTPPAPTRVPLGEQAHIQTFVRSGDGAITANAARDIDLRGSEDIVYRLATGQTVGIRAESDGLTALQVAGAALYTAGVRAAAGITTAQLADGSVRSVNRDGPLFAAPPATANSMPTPAARTDHAPVLAQGGGDIRLVAGRDVLGRTDFWTYQAKQYAFESTSYSNRADPKTTNTVQSGQIGAPNQIWRAGTVGGDTDIGILPSYFSSGVGALAGGDVSVSAGRDVSDLTVALDTGVTTDKTGANAILVTLGAGDLSVDAGRDLLGGRFDVASGAAVLKVGRDAGLFATPVNPDISDVPYTEGAIFRLENATVTLRAGGVVAGLQTYGLGAGTVQDVNSITVAGRSQANAGLYSTVTALDVTALGDIDFAGGNFVPPTLELASLQGTVSVKEKTTLYPSPIGQLSILSAGDISNLAIAMLDMDPSLLRQSAFAAGTGYEVGISRITGVQAGEGAFQLVADFPGINPVVDEVTRRLMHNSRITHLDDSDPARIYTDGSLDNASINLAKFGNIRAEKDIIDTYFVGQNVRAGDETRISAGRDITATNRTGNSRSGLPYFNGTSFYLGGPGTLSVEAGRNLGPFMTSATIRDERGTGGLGQAQFSFGGGIITVGNLYNPWLAAQGADLNVSFGVAPGQDLVGLRETYLNPALFAQLDGDLFVQAEDQFGVDRPDRTRQVYAPVLAGWLRDNEPALFVQIFGSATFADEAALGSAAYGQSQALYDAFTTLSLQRQRQFLIKQVYFNELAQPSLGTSPSFQQYIRGYRAVEALFPAALGYTDNLAAYETDPATITPDNPLGVPRRRTVNGQPVAAERVVTGNADLRLATFQTARGGDLTILAPGGDFLVGSVVRTAEQISRRNTRFVLGLGVNAGVETGSLNPLASSILSIPLGYEGLLTLRGGGINSFTDGSLRLNQSRLFTLAGGDITAWSSNGDLNAGQGPKSAADFPPVTVRFDLNGSPEVDTAGSVSGAGIGAFKRSPDDADARIVLVAPVGEVDAGDAGVRASGNIFVAAARVANADNFSAGGSVVGVPSAAPVASAAPPSSAASAVANVARVNQQGEQDDRRTNISVDVLGFAGGDKCRDPQNGDPDCPI